MINQLIQVFKEVLKKSPSASVVEEKAATLFFCEAPEKFIQNFTRLPVSMGMSR